MVVKERRKCGGGGSEAGYTVQRDPRKERERERERESSELRR